MKRLFSFFIAICIFFADASAKPNVNASQKVLQAFNNTFSNEKNVKWFSIEDGYVASFIQNDIRTSITYNKDGRFVSSRRYYGENKVPFNILLKIKEKYKGKTMGIVTEVLQDDRIIYSVNLEDEENFYVVESNSNADLTLSSKFRKQHFSH